MVLTDAAFARPRRLARSNQPALKVAAMFAVYGSGRRIGERFINERNRRLGAEGVVRETFRLCAADPSSISPQLVAAHVEMTRQRFAFDYGVPAFLAAARSIFRSQAMPGAYRQLVRDVRAPALVIHGARDQLVPVAAAREATQEHANWRLEVLPDLGHIPMLEAPQRWLDLVNAWLDQSLLGDQAEPRSNTAG
jgi:pimeloyl-ACP methyl ester carboxylesterase